VITYQEFLSIKHTIQTLSCTKSERRHSYGWG